MKKIPSLFKRNFSGDRLVYNEICPGTEWIINGEGIATRKYDGTCCFLRNGKFYKRYELKKGKTPPDNFEPTGDIEEITGNQTGWVPVGDGNEDKYHRDGLEFFMRENGFDIFRFNFESICETFELIGEKVQSNPEKISGHNLISHKDAEKLLDCPREYDLIREYFRNKDIEGIVWHHPDGRMAKIKKRDFGINRIQNIVDEMKM